MFTRRTALTTIAASAASAAPLTKAAAAATRPDSAANGLRAVFSSPTQRWHNISQLRVVPASTGPYDISFRVMVNAEQQKIEGFGGAFSELGWDALSKLTPAKREMAVNALFGEDAKLNLCRTPIGASDFARNFYSYDETDGDFAMEHFSIARDKTGLLPFIKAAQTARPNLRLWGSPWSPPTWMKINKHYAQSKSRPGAPENGLRDDQVVKSGTNGFIQQDAYFEAYARYFRRYVEAYRAEGVPISLVMPQNEFNSPHPFPGCVWTPEALARFIPHLGQQMDPLGVRIFLGTLERDKPEAVAKVMADPAASAYVKGVGVQWAGKDALPIIHREHPDLAIWGSELECGTGDNSWRFTRYCWSLMLRYFRSGASAWQYWNMVLANPGISTWGWPQNALISVDTARNNFTLTNDYWLLRHLSAFVEQGARHLPTASLTGWDDQLAFRNPNGDIVIVVHNGLAQPSAMTVALGKFQLEALCPADSFATFVIPAQLL